MRTIKAGTTPGETDGFFIGIRGEKNITKVVFNYDDWYSEFGDGTVSMLALRPGDEVAYPVALEYDYDAHTATWIVSDVDTDKEGKGKAQFIFTIGEQVAKTIVFKTAIGRDIGHSDTQVPDPFETWVDRLEDLGDITLQNALNAYRAQQAAELAQSSAEDAQTAAETAQGAAEEAQALAENARDTASGAAAAAETSAGTADSRAEDSEAWAVGQRSGEDVTSSDETFNNNAKYYKTMAEQVATENGYASLWIADDGILYLARTSNIEDRLDFALTQDGELEAIIYG